VVFKFPVRNTGHTPSSWIKGKIRYERLDIEEFTKHPKSYSTMPFIEERTVEVMSNHPIPPDQADHSITIMLPQLSQSDFDAIDANKQGLMIRGKFEYDTGFKSIDVFDVCARYDGKTGTWKGCGGGSGINIDLGQTPPKKGTKK
jgi:hypothetical protein